MSTIQKSGYDSISIKEKIRELGPWFHNLHLPNGIQTAPDHGLGDYPTYKWIQFKDHLPNDLTGWNILDIGCNAGFYSFELAKRGATIFAIDSDEHYLRQANWAREQYGFSKQITFKQMQIYDLSRLNKTFDLVLFMGIFYHLRYPLLGLDIAASKAKRLLVFQCLLLPGNEVLPANEDYSMEQTDRLLQPGWPVMAFIEKQFAGDPTNWWIPNRSAVEAMLRSSGLKIRKKLSHEIYICEAGKEVKENSKEYRKALKSVKYETQDQGGSGT